MNGVLLQIAGRNGIDTQYRMGPTSHSRADDGFGPDPNSVFNNDRFRDEVKTGFGVVMVACQQHGSLGERDIVTDRDGSQVVDPDVLADRTVVSYGQEPRELDIDSGFEVTRASDFGPENPQQKKLGPHPGNESIPDEQFIQEIPNGSLPQGTWLVVPITVLVSINSESIHGKNTG